MRFVLCNDFINGVGGEQIVDYLTVHRQLSLLLSVLFLINTDSVNYGSFSRVPYELLEDSRVWTFMNSIIVASCVKIGEERKKRDKNQTVWRLSTSFLHPLCSPAGYLTRDAPVILLWTLIAERGIEVACICKVGDHQSKYFNTFGTIMVTVYLIVFWAVLAQTALPARQSRELWILRFLLGYFSF